MSKPKLGRTSGSREAPDRIGKSEPAEASWGHAIAIKLFQASSELPSKLDLAALSDFPTNRPVPGFLCQAARTLVGLTQSELHVRSQVSKKSLNDYENSLVSLRPTLVSRIVNALHEEGARFVAGDGFVGVVVRARREDILDRSRSPKRRDGGLTPRPDAAWEAAMPTGMPNRARAGRATSERA